MNSAGETPETSAWKDRWSVKLCCERCQAVFTFDRDGMALTVQQTAPFTRMLVLRVPEVCPQCRSLQLVVSSTPAPSPAPESA